MPHARLVAISTEHAKATGLAMAEMHKLRSSGIPASAMTLLGALEGHLGTLSNLNAEMGPIAHGLSDETASEPKDGSPSGSAATDTAATGLGKATRATT